MGLGIFNGDINTLECALLERMYYCKIDGQFVEPPTVAQTTYKRLNKFRNKVIRNVGSPSVLTLQEVVDTYTGRKRTIYENAFNSLCIKPVNRDDAVSVAFVKVEKGKPGKAPRCIQPRNPRYNIVVGKYIKAAEHRIYKAIALVFGDGPTVMKGYNVNQIGRIIAAKWRSFTDPVAIMIDAVKFDMHCSPQSLRWEHSTYNRIFSSPELRRLLKWQISNKGRGYCDDGKLKYEVEGRRFSGDMNTALGNVMIMCGLVWTYAQERGVLIKLVNNGDDCVIFCERADLAKFMLGFDAWFKEFGFRMTVEETALELEHIEFCQMHPVYTPNGYTMVRNIRTALAKDTMTVLPVNNEGSARAWFKAIGQCGLSLTSGIPMMQSFYRMYDRQTSKNSNISKHGAMQTGMAMLARNMEHKYTVPTAETRYSFWLAFGFTPDEQRAYEGKFDHYLVDYDRIVPADYNTVTHFEL
jgi:hypothetical protein